jgi:hypothetical protein
MQEKAYRRHLIKTYAALVAALLITLLVIAL